MRFLFIKKCERSQHASFQGGSERFLLVDWSVGNRVVRSKININKNRQAFMRKAKIVDTIGPATESLEGITSLVEAGMDVARLNRSHGTPEDHLKVYNNLRAAAKATGRNVAALVDLQGPKIRCGLFKKNADGEDEIMDEEGRRIPVVAKIEKPQALENLEEIVKAFDGIMVARGDMAVECPLEEVPLATKRCIELARQYAKPVIVATEVLGSMVNSPVPTRAEASDCANAILDGADATMTSNETAVGKYPAVTVSTMSRISSFATEHGFDRIPELKNLDMSSTGAVSSAAVDLADKLNAKAIVAYTQTGSTVHRVSRERPATPIYGITNNEHTYHWLALSWGTESFLLDEDYHDKSRKDLMIFTDKILKDAGKVTDGDKIVVLSSAQGEHQPGRTDSIYVHTVGACD